MKSTDIPPEHKLQELDFEMVGITPARRRESSTRDWDKIDSPEEIIQKAELNSEDRDLIDLLRLGKTQVLKVCAAIQ